MGESMKIVLSRRWLIFVLVINFLSVFRSVCAWDGDGYEAIGMTAVSAIGHNGVAKLHSLVALGKWKDLTEVGEWARTLKDTYPQIRPMHYQLQARDKFAGEEPPELTLDSSVCPDGLCLLTAVKHFYNRLMMKSGASAKDVEPKINFPGTKTFTDMDSFIILAILIADLHHPLSFGLMNDMCGQKIEGAFFDGVTKKNVTLYDFWNSEVVQFVVRERSNYWQGGWTHLNELGMHRYVQEKEIWRNADNDQRLALFEKWATESLAMASTIVYADHKNGFSFGLRECLFGFEYLKQRMLLAGARLALVADTIFETKEVGRLRQGSAIIVRKAEEVQANPRALSQTHKQPPNHLKNLLLNFSVFLAVLGIFCYLSKYFSSPQTAYGSIVHAPKEKELAKFS